MFREVFRVARAKHCERCLGVRHATSWPTPVSSRSIDIPYVPNIFLHLESIMWAIVWRTSWYIYQAWSIVFLQPGSRWALWLGHGESHGFRGARHRAGLCGQGQRATLGQWHGVTDGVDSSARELGHRAHWPDLCHGGNGRHCRWNQGGLQSFWMWRVMVHWTWWDDKCISV